MQSFSLSKRRKKRDDRLMISIWLMLFVVTGPSGAWWWQGHKAQQGGITTMADQSSAGLNNSQNQSVPLDTSTITDQTMATTPTSPVDTTITNTQIPAVTAPASAVDPQQNAVVPSSQTNVDIAATPAPAAITTPDGVASSLTDQIGAITPVVDPNALVMNFVADYWLEVIGVIGKKLFSSAQREDDNLNLTGQVSYKLRVGVPATVQIQYQGKPVDLSCLIRTNQVACLTPNAEQSPV